MGTAYIDTVISVSDGGIILFEVECVAEVEYTTTRADGLEGWHVSNLRFDDTRTEWNDTEGVWQRRRIGEAWASKSLFNVLLPHIDQRELEEELVEHLYATGELAYANPCLRADYHAAVL